MRLISFKLNHQGTAGFGPCCYLPIGFHFWVNLFLTTTAIFLFLLAPFDSRSAPWPRVPRSSRRRWARCWRRAMWRGLPSGRWVEPGMSDRWIRQLAVKALETRRHGKQCGRHVQMVVSCCRLGPLEATLLSKRSRRLGAYTVGKYAANRGATLRNCSPES